MQAETGVYSTFLSVFCFCYPVWNMIYPIHHILLFSIFSQLRMTSHQIHSTCSESPISNSNMPLPGNRRARFLKQSKNILNTIDLINRSTTSSHLSQTIQWLSNEQELHHITHTLIAYPFKSSKAPRSRWNISSHLPQTIQWLSKGRERHQTYLSCISIQSHRKVSNLILLWATSIKRRL